MITTSKIPIKVVRNDKEILGELLKNIAKTEATQVFVTGPEAYRILDGKDDSISAALGKSWTVLPPRVAPTQADMRSLLEEFATAIEAAPSQQHICFGPIAPERLLEYLFRLSKNGAYKAGLYILGMYDPPMSSLQQFGQAVNVEGKASGFLESIISLEDRLLLIREQKELTALLEQGADVSDKLWEIMTSRQEQVDAEEKALRAPLPTEKTGFLDRLFHKKSSAEVAARFAEADRRNRGLLPPPQGIAFNYRCECGVYLNVDLNNFNVISGVQVQCAHCGAVCFVPPEILDQTKYDPSRRGAFLRGDYQSLLRFVRHGSKNR